MRYVSSVWWFACYLVVSFCMLMLARLERLDASGNGSGG
jgi:hypothetical protein